MAETGYKTPLTYVFQGNNIIVPPNFSEQEALGGVMEQFFFPLVQGLPFFDVPLFDGEAPIRTYLLGEAHGVPPLWRSVPLRSLLPLITGTQRAEGLHKPSTLFRSYHVAKWRVESAFCGRCGSPNTDAKDELARHCPVCGRREYPRISPAIIVLITDKSDRILLAHNGKFNGAMYSLIAGFVETGESLEATVSREVWEEVHVEVQNIRYRASQSWPFPDSLMIGFRATSETEQPIPDKKEILDARWFTRDSLPQLPMPGSISRLLIDAWIAEGDGR
jgi:NAD+ diphosphatase